MVALLLRALGRWDINQGNSMKKSNVLAGLSVVAGLAMAASTMTTAQDAITQRRDIMKGVGGAAKVSNEMIKGDKPYDAKIAADAMTKIATGTGEILKLFPKGSETGGESRASPKVWENFKDFEDKMQAFSKTAATAVGEAAKGPDAFKAAFGAVGGSCKGCHDIYLLPKK